MSRKHNPLYENSLTHRDVSSSKSRVKKGQYKHREEIQNQSERQSDGRARGRNRGSESVVQCQSRGINRMRHPRQTLNQRSDLAESNTRLERSVKRVRRTSK